MGCFRKIVKLICVPILIFAGVLLGPNTLPDPVTFTEFYVAPTKYLGEGLKDNQLLNNAERLFEDEIKGPEGFEVVNGELYTTLHGGYVAKVYEDQVIPVVKFGQDCIGWWEESKCGRPLGLKAYGKDELIVADAYFGIFKFNTKTGKFTNLVGKNTVIDGKKVEIFNGVEVGKDGSIYWTHSSSDFTLQDTIYTVLADGSGRVIKYDPNTQKNYVLMKNLFYPNGLVLSPDEDFLLVAETGHSRILRYYLKGPKKSTTDIFIDGLPGTPDNLRQNGIGGFFVPLGITRDEKTPCIFQVLTPFPKLRKFAARALSYADFALTKIHEIYPSYFTQRAIHFVGHFESAGLVLPLKATILEVDINGNVMTSYHGTDGSVTSISDVIVHNGYMYLGSPVNNYLGRVKLSKLEGNRPKKFEPAGWKVPPTTRPPPPTTTPKPATRAPPPPTTTTPRPTTRPPPPPTRAPSPPPTRAPPPPTTTPKPSPPPTRPPPPPSTTTPPPPRSHHPAPPPRQPSPSAPPAPPARPPRSAPPAPPARQPPSAPPAMPPSPPPTRPPPPPSRPPTPTPTPAPSQSQNTDRQKRQAPNV